MDPQLRKLLEVAYEAWMDAGVDFAALRGSDRVGVYVGACGSETHAQWLGDIPSITGYEQTGCAQSMFPNRLSWWFDFRGPSKCIDTGGLWHLGLHPMHLHTGLRTLKELGACHVHEHAEAGCSYLEGSRCPLAEVAAALGMQQAQHSVLHVLFSSTCLIAACKVCLVSERWSVQRTPAPMRFEELLLETRATMCGATGSLRPGAQQCRDCACHAVPADRLCMRARSVLVVADGVQRRDDRPDHRPHRLRGRRRRVRHLQAADLHRLPAPAHDVPGRARPLSLPAQRTCACCQAGLHATHAGSTVEDAERLLCWATHTSADGWHFVARMFGKHMLCCSRNQH